VVLAPRSGSDRRDSCFLFRNPNSWRQAMLDRDTKELLLGFTAIVIFAVAIVYLRQ